MTELLQRIQRILAAESAYAEILRTRGDFGRAKYIWAAINEIGRAVRSVEGEREEGYAERLHEALEEAKRQYRYDWNDEDGIGTSSFSRVLDQF